MRFKIFLAVFSIIILAVVAGFFDWPQQISYLPEGFFKPFHLGLDLQGGAHLVYEANVENIPPKERDEALSGVRDVIERRVNAFGVAEPLVQTTKTGNHWRVIVELAGVKDIEAAKKMIGETPILEFKEENPQPQRDLTPEERKEMEDYNAQAKEKAGKVLKELKDGADFSKLMETYSQDSDEIKKMGGDLGFVSVNSADNNERDIATVLGAKEVAPGSVYQEAIETNDGFNIVKLEDKKATEKEIKASHILICFKGAEGCEKETTKEEARKQIEELKIKATIENFASLVKEYSTEPGAGEREGDLGWFGKGKMVKEFEEAAFAQGVGTISDIAETKFGFHLIYKKEERALTEFKVKRILIKTKKPWEIAPYEPWKYTGLSGKQLVKAMVQFNPTTGIPQVSLKFDGEGAKLFAEITKRNVGKPVAIFLDQEPISIPRVQEAITGGEAVITGDFTFKESKVLAQRLNAGALPVPIELKAEQIVEASLGKDSLEKSLKAGLIGLIVLALFMLLYYRLLGVSAVLSLAVYGVIVLAIFKLIPITLTLAGIAGVILSLGMAVDANVLVFERLKEELKAGTPFSVALNQAFQRAWLAIRDGNLTTLITCFVLATFSTSSVKGFAITLMIGVLVSLFSGMIVTRVFLLVYSYIRKNS